MITYPELVAALVKPGASIVAELQPNEAHLLHMTVGVSGEAGELLDAIKKHVIYRKPLNLRGEHGDGCLIEELGDLEFYMEGIRQATGITREETLTANIAKLQKRYDKLKYSDQSAQERKDKTT